MTSSARRMPARCAPQASEHGSRIAAVLLSEYQARSRATALYPRDVALYYPTLGLAGEAGEVAEHAKKLLRDDAGVLTDERREAMAKELGVVLWYLAQIASRKQRGVLHGSGDDR